MRRVHYVSGDGSKHCDIVKYDNQITIMHNMILRLKKKCINGIESYIRNGYRVKFHFGCNGAKMEVGEKKLSNDSLFIF